MNTPLPSPRPQAFYQELINSMVEDILIKQTFDRFDMDFWLDSGKWEDETTINPLNNDKSWKCDTSCCIVGFAATIDPNVQVLIFEHGELDEVVVDEQNLSTVDYATSVFGPQREYVTNYSLWPQYLSKYYEASFEDVDEEDTQYLSVAAGIMAVIEFAWDEWNMELEVPDALLENAPERSPGILLAIYSMKEDIELNHLA